MIEADNKSPDLLNFFVTSSLTKGYGNGVQRSPL